MEAIAVTIKGSPPRDLRVAIEKEDARAHEVGHNLGPWKADQGSGGYRATCSICRHEVDIYITPDWVKKDWSGAPDISVGWNPGMAEDECISPRIPIYRGYHINDPGVVGQIVSLLNNNRAEVAEIILDFLGPQLGDHWSGSEHIARGYSKGRVLNLEWGSSAEFDFDPKDYDGEDLPVFVRAEMRYEDQPKSYRYDSPAELPEYEHENEVWLRKHEKIRILGVEVWAGGQWHDLGAAQTMRTAGFTGFVADPHDVLYPCVWKGIEMRPEARDVFREIPLSAIESVLPNAIDITRFWVIGSGASWNWDEDGDIDVQVWVDCAPEQIQAVRDALEPLRGQTCADYGLTIEGCPGRMAVQFFARAGKGTTQETLDRVPYAAYDIDNETWAVLPEPMTPEGYAALFLAVSGEAEAIADQAEIALAHHDRTTSALAYWQAMTDLDPDFAPMVTEAQAEVVKTLAEVQEVYDAVVEGRQEAYKPGGLGIKDPRDSIVKVLEVWGIFDRLKHIVMDAREQAAKIAKEVQDVDLQVLLIDGDLVKVKRIERDDDQVYVITTLDKRIPAERIVTYKAASIDDVLLWRGDATWSPMEIGYEDGSLGRQWGTEEEVKAHIVDTAAHSGVAIAVWWPRNTLDDGVLPKGTIGRLDHIEVWDGAGWVIQHGGESMLVTADLTTSFSEPGEYGNRTHITLEQRGTLSIDKVRDMPGVMGEVPGEHRNRHGQEWDDFVADVKANGILNPIFITVDPGQQPHISEGNHRRDAAVEAGQVEVPVLVRYFGHAERDNVLAVVAATRAKDALNISDYFASGVDFIEDTPWRHDDIHIALDPYTWQRQPTEDVSVHGLHYTQEYLRQKYVDKRGEDEADLYDLPWIVEYKGERWVMDGHHRIVKAIQEGKSTIRCHVMHVRGDVTSLGSKTSATDHIRKALENEGLVQCARDGDCFPVSEQVKAALERAGIESDVVVVMGWLGENLLGFGHAAVLVKDSDTIVDATATQYDPSLPPLIITSVEAYKDMLAKATGVERVTVQVGKTAGGPSWRAHTTQPFWTWYEACIFTNASGRGRTFEVFMGDKMLGSRPSLAEAKAVVEKEYGPQEWKRESLPLVEVEHYYFGPTTEFTDPLTYYYVDEIVRSSIASIIRESLRTIAAKGGKIARGIYVTAPDDGYTVAEARRMEHGLTVDQILKMVGRDSVGVWWGQLGTEFDMVDIEDFATGPSGLEESVAKNLQDEYDMVAEDGEGRGVVFGEIAVVLVGQAPDDWDPYENPLQAGGLMGSSFLPDGTHIPLSEIRYNAGWGWKTLSVSTSVTASEVYQTGHQPDPTGPPLNDITQPGNYMEGVDVYEHPERYTGERRWLSATKDAMVEAKGKPDFIVTIYRAAPPQAIQIKPGDWVTLSREYATQHIESNGKPDWKVIAQDVPARTVLFAGDDLMEWGYFP